MKRNKNIASFLFSVFSTGMLSQALMSSASGTDILKTEKLVKEAELQQNSSSTDDENIEGSSNIEEEVQDIGANDNDDANSAGMVYIDRNKVNGALANKQLIKVASFLLPTLGVGALGGSAYHFLKKEDKNKEPSEVNTEIKDEDEPNLEDTKGEKEDNKVTDNLNTSTSVWCYVIAIVVVLIIISAVYVYYIKNNKKKNENENNNEVQGSNNTKVINEKIDEGKIFEEEKNEKKNEEEKNNESSPIIVNKKKKNENEEENENIVIKSNDEKKNEQYDNNINGINKKIKEEKNENNSENEMNNENEEKNEEKKENENKNKNDDKRESEEKFIDNKKHESNNKGKNNTENKEMIVDNEKSYFKILLDLLVDFKKVLEKDSACVKFTGKTILVGDLHFNTGAALFVKKYFEEKVNGGYNLVFLGDFIDRGKQATYGTIFEEDGKTMDKVATAEWRLKTLEIIMDLKIQYPDKVIVLSGNHEADEGINREFGFWDECKNAFGEVDGKDVFNKANKTFGELPKCAVLEQKGEDGKEDLNTFLVHGSVPCSKNLPCSKDSVKLMDSKKLERNILDDMSNLNRKKSYKYEAQPKNEESGIVSGMVWNDYRAKVKEPWPGQPDYRVYEEVDEPNVVRKEGFWLSDKSLSVFKEVNNIQRVISAHDHAEPYKNHEDANYIKVITSPNMGYKEPDGYILDIDEHGNITKVKVEEISYETFKQQEANNISNIDNKNFSNNISNNINNNIIIQNINNIN